MEGQDGLQKDKMKIFYGFLADCPLWRAEDFLLEIGSSLCKSNFKQKLIASLEKKP
jgi:hypothetical protein